jgi:hypothetical protein
LKSQTAIVKDVTLIFKHPIWTPVLADGIWVRAMPEPKRPSAFIGRYDMDVCFNEIAGRGERRNRLLGDSLLKAGVAFSAPWTSPKLKFLILNS